MPSPLLERRLAQVAESGSRNSFCVWAAGLLVQAL